MGKCTCKKNPCCCGGGNGQGQGNSADQLAQVSAQVAANQQTLATLTTSLQAFLTGHPILMLDHADDIACFDLSTGLGKNNWLGWGICKGNSYPNPNTGKNVLTPNLIDRVPVQATGAYAMDAVFGADNVVLTVPQLPSHNHAVTDPGHHHNITDAGHTHGIVDPGHVHATVCTATSVTGTTDTQGGHEHAIYNSHQMQVGGGGQFVIGGGLVGTEGGGAGAGSPLSCSPPNQFLEPAGAHTHAITINDFNPSIDMSPAETGISTQSAFTGITETDSANTGITIANTGAGSAVDIRQKSYALLFVMKIY